MLRILSGSWQNIAIFATNRQAHLFSPVGVARLGLMSYGDIVPLHGKVRMLPALEGITGSFYVAITAASFI